MPVSFLTAEPRDSYGRYAGTPSVFVAVPEAVIRGELKPCTILLMTRPTRASGKDNDLTDFPVPLLPQTRNTTPSLSLTGMHHDSTFRREPSMNAVNEKERAGSRKYYMN